MTLTNELKVCMVELTITLPGVDGKPDVTERRCVGFYEDDNKTVMAEMDRVGKTVKAHLDARGLGERFCLWKHSGVLGVSQI